MRAYFPELVVNHEVSWGSASAVAAKKSASEVVSNLFMGGNIITAYSGFVWDKAENCKAGVNAAANNGALVGR